MKLRNLALCCCGVLALCSGLLSPSSVLAAEYITPSPPITDPNKDARCQYFAWLYRECSIPNSSDDDDEEEDEEESSSSSSSSGGNLFAIVLAFLFNSQREMSALKILAQQQALAAQQMSDTITTAAETGMHAMAAVFKQGKLAQAILDYAPETGMPSGMSCSAMTEEDATETVKAYAKQYAQHIGQQWVTNPSAENDTAGVLDANLEMHKQNFCTTSEAQQGSCSFKFNGMQGYDMHYGTIARNYTMHEDLELAAWAYVSNLVGRSVTPSVRLQCKSVACQSGQMSQLRSIALNTAALDAMSSQIAMRRAMNWNTHQHKLNEALPLMVGSKEAGK